MRLVLCAFAIVAAVSAPAAAQDAPAAEIIAAQVRIQGHPCGKAQGAVRSPTASRPDEPLWRLTCDDAVYDVRLVPDQAAKIVVIKQ